MNIQELARQLKQNYRYTHEIEWGLYKFAYFKPDGTEVWTDAPREAYIEYQQIAELDKKRDEITTTTLIYIFLKM